MNLERKKKYALLCVSTILPALLVVASINYVANSEDSGDNGNTITIKGGESVHINKMITSDFHFSPNSPIHVRQGDTVTIKETTGDGHTLTFVVASALPTTFNGVIFCGNPAIISPGFVGSPACVQAPGYPFALHLVTPPACSPPATPCFPPPWLPIPGSCTVGPFTICHQYVDGGVASNTNTLGVDTPWSFSPSGSVATPGDSILVLPGQTIAFTVTAAVGSHLHFMCIFHPWMQGEIIVNPAGE